jgi:glycosyltransferase involved in cell wall biosynthesis
MNINSTRVSVIIATHSRPQLLRRAIDSVIQQTYKDFEVIVVDDNGAGTAMQKETEAVVSGFPNTIYHANRSNLGKAASLNLGIKRASGELLAFLDDDDEFRCDKLAKQIVRLEETKAAGVYCNYERIFRNQLYFRSSHQLGKDEGDLALDMLLGRNEICGGSTLLLRSSVVSETGGFDERFKRHIDWAFLVCYFRKYKLSLCSDVLVTVHMDDHMWGKVSPKLQFETKQLFFSLFEEDVARHGEAVPEIYSKHWLDVYRGCLGRGQVVLAIRSLGSAINKGRISIPSLLRATGSAVKHAHR